MPVPSSAGGPRRARAGRARRARRAVPILLGALFLTLAAACAVPVSPSTSTTTSTTSGPPPSPPTVAATASSGTELASSSLPGVERDCSLSTALPWGATLWVFCDTVKPGSFLVTSTAAAAPPNAPTGLVDYVASNGWPARFLETTPEEDALADAQRGTYPNAYAGIQPTSVTTLADGTVVVFYLRMLTLEAMHWQLLGSGIARFTLSNAQAAGTEPLVATRMVDDLFSTSEPAFGQAAAFQDGYVFTIGCERRTTPNCFLARVAASSLTTRAAWQFFDGTGWSATLAAAAPIDIPNVPNEYALIGLTRLSSGLWALSLSPTPGFTNAGQVSFAPAITGPWSAAQRFTLPSCGTDITTNCYGLEVQGPLTTPSQLGVTYFSFGSSRTEFASVATTG